MKCSGFVMLCVGIGLSMFGCGRASNSNLSDASLSPKKIYNVQDEERFKKLVEYHTDRKIITMTGATWCGPCKKLKEKLTAHIQSDKVSADSELLFFYTDVDAPFSKEFYKTYLHQDGDTVTLPQLFAVNDGESLVLTPKAKILKEQADKTLLEVEVSVHPKDWKLEEILPKEDKENESK